MRPNQNPSYPETLTPPWITLSSIAFQVMSNGPPKAPEPPSTRTPPLIVAKWICTDAGSVAWTPSSIVPVVHPLRSLPRTNVAPDPIHRPSRMLTGPRLRHTASFGTTTRP